MKFNTVYVVTILVSIFILGCNGPNTNEKMAYINDSRVELEWGCAFTGHTFSTGGCKKALNWLDENGFRPINDETICTELDEDLCRVYVSR